jgi:hypothetical protein
MLKECVGQLDEPFRRSEVVGWFRRHYPEVNEATLAAHIQAVTANAPNRAQNHPYLGARAPLLRRIDHACTSGPIHPTRRPKAHHRRRPPRIGGPPSAGTHLTVRGTREAAPPWPGEGQY